MTPFRRFWTGLVLLSASACADPVTSPYGQRAPDPSPSGPAVVAAYLDELMRIMQLEAANAAVIDERFRTEVVAAAADAQTIPAAYPAIERALRLLNDFESHYIGRDGRLIGPPRDGGCSLLAPPATLPATVGYVKVEQCVCAGSGANRYAEALQTAIRNADRPELSGWIVDLRENIGGNMWPMIAGLGPILGEGIMGWIVYNNREYEREYRGGAAMSLGEPFAWVDVPYMLTKSDPRVAVLTSSGTASAAEAITVWFKNRPGTRSFGTATCGHHHLLESYPMSDRASLTLKIAHNADRLKHSYAGPIAPDETIADPAEQVRRAVQWLQSEQ